MWKTILTFLSFLTTIVEKDSKLDNNLQVSNLDINNFMPAVDDFAELEWLVNQYGITTDLKSLKKSALSRTSTLGLATSTINKLKDSVMSPILDNILQFPETRIAVALYIKEYPNEAGFVFGNIIGDSASAAFHLDHKKIYISTDISRCTSQLVVTSKTIRHELAHSLYHVLGLENEIGNKLTKEQWNNTELNPIFLNTFQCLFRQRDNPPENSCTDDQRKMALRGSGASDYRKYKLLTDQEFMKMIEPLRLAQRDFLEDFRNSTTELCNDKNRIIVEFDKNSGPYKQEIVKMYVYLGLTKNQSINEAFSVFQSNLPCMDDRKLIEENHPCHKLEEHISEFMAEQVIGKYNSNKILPTIP